MASSAQKQKQTAHVICDNPIEAHRHDLGRMTLRAIRSRFGIANAVPDTLVLVSWRHHCKLCEQRFYREECPRQRQRLRYHVRPHEKTRLTVHNVAFLLAGVPVTCSFHGCAVACEEHVDHQQYEYNALVTVDLDQHPDVYFGDVLASPTLAPGYETALSFNTERNRWCLQIYFCWNPNVALGTRCKDGKCVGSGSGGGCVRHTLRPLRRIF